MAAAAWALAAWPQLPPLLILMLTVAMAGLLSYLLMWREGSFASPTSSSGRRRPEDQEEEYFQKVVMACSETLGRTNGAEQNCTWTQNDDEVEVCATMPAGARAKDVSCKVLPQSIALSIQGAGVVQGKLFRRVRHDDSDWAIEERAAGERVLKVTLVKAVPTKGAQHWTSLLASTG